MSYVYDIVVQPLIFIIEIAFSLLNRIVGNPGLAIVGVSIVVNFLCLPLYQMADKQQQDERARQKQMERWVTHIKEHFSGNEQYMMLTEYYRQVGYNPLMSLNGSISLLLQIPFFIAAYNYLSGLTLLKHQSFLAITDLSAADGLLVLGGVTVNLLPVAMTLLNCASTYFYTKGLGLRDKLQAYGLALLFLVLLYKSPSGLVLYWTCNQIFSLIKNIVVKRVHDTRLALVTVCQVIVLVLAFFLVRHHVLHTPKRTIAAGLMGIVTELVLWVPHFVHGTKIAKTREGDSITADTVTFVMLATLLTFIMGLLIPGALVGAAPEDFMDVNDFVDVMRFIWFDLRVYGGLFILWGGVFYYLSNDRGRATIILLYLMLAGVFLFDFMCFGKNLGIIESNLVFESDPQYSSTTQLLNLALVSAVAVALTVVASRAPKLVRPMSIILTLTILVTSLPNIVVSYQTSKSIGEKVARQNVTAQFFNEDGSAKPLFTLSKKGKNVLVLFIDRAISAYLPYILNERPELVSQLDGFTYYPNCISHGAQTIFGSPGLYGGYEYTPAAMNERSDMLLVDKHNEALRVMPTIFSTNGFETTVIDPPFVNYRYHNDDVSIFDDLENVNAYHLVSAYNKYQYPEFAEASLANLKRSFVFYSMFKACPVLFQPYLYDDGHYLSTSTNANATSDAFIDNYAILRSLNELTDISDGDENTFCILANCSTHEATFLQLPEYEPSLDVNNVGLEPRKRTSADGSTIKFTMNRHVRHYQINMATFLQLGKWFDWLRDQGVYDNTRIIIVSDHGRDLKQYPTLREAAETESEKKLVSAIEPLMAMLLVKDFDAHGFTTSDEFMTNADTPTLAMEGLPLSSTDNPYTGNPIDSSAKDAPYQIVSSSRMWDAEKQQGTTFNTDDLPWFTIHDNIFDFSNWTPIEDPTKEAMEKGTNLD